jgi:transposase
MARPPKLTPELQQLIASRVRAGIPVEVAVRACGVGTSTHYRWQAQHPEYRELVHQARAEGELHRVAQITVAARTDWKAAAWYLEREFPDRWATGKALG